MDARGGPSGTSAQGSSWPGPSACECGRPGHSVQLDSAVFRLAQDFELGGSHHEELDSSAADECRRPSLVTKKRRLVAAARMSCRRCVPGSPKRPGRSTHRSFRSMQRRCGRSASTARWSPTRRSRPSPIAARTAWRQLGRQPDQPAHSLPRQPSTGRRRATRRIPLRSRLTACRPVRRAAALIARLPGPATSPASRAASSARRPARATGSSSARRVRARRPAWPGRRRARAR